MQKLDFIIHLEEIIDKLHSEPIFDLFISGLSEPNKTFGYNDITPILFISKSNYDQLKLDPGKSRILQNLGADQVFDEGNLSKLTTILRATKATDILLKIQAINLFNFHNTLINTYKLAKETLIGIESDIYFADADDNGVVIFQILIESKGLEPNKYIKILTALNELIEVISMVVHEDDEKPEVILLDSGSDTNLGIKSGVETAKSLFLVFKEIWEYVTNYKAYKQSRINNTILESLSIRAEIKKKVDEGVLTEQEGQEYTHIVKTRTDNLIGMKVLPKSIVAENKSIDNRNILTEYEGLKIVGKNDSRN